MPCTRYASVAVHQQVASVLLPKCANDGATTSSGPRFPKTQNQLPGSPSCPCKDASLCIPTSNRKIRRNARRIIWMCPTCLGNQQSFRVSGSRSSIRTAPASPRPCSSSSRGAVVPLHEHTALEQTYVIEGSLEDHEGKCGPGQFVWRPAGNQHEAVAPNG